MYGPLDRLRHKLLRELAPMALEALQVAFRTLAPEMRVAIMPRSEVLVEVILITKKPPGLRVRDLAREQPETGEKKSSGWSPVCSSQSLL